MKTIPLTQGKVALVDDEDFEYLSQWKWCYGKGYAMRNGPRNHYKRRVIWMHRLIIDAPESLEVDHKNLDKLDNRKENLRACTHAENCRNVSAGKRNSTGFRGVSFNKKTKRYMAMITSNGVSKFLGYFDNAEDAYSKRREHIHQYHGEFARTE